MRQAAAGRRDPAGFVIAGLIAALAALILWDTSRLQITSTYGLGPEAMPIAVASGLGLLAVGNLIMALRGDLPPREPADTRAILLILGGLAGVIVLLAIGGGFIPSCAILFATTAAAFGRRAFFADLALGAVLGVVIYLLFAKLLTLSLPAGPLERLF
jgi:putative tricarboxylic transport membrane protein